MHIPSLSKARRSLNWVLVEPFQVSLQLVMVQRRYLVWEMSLIQVVITDYPDTELIENIRYNVLNCGIEKNIQAQIAVKGYLWGSDATPLLSHLGNDSKFDIIILSDTVSSFPTISLIRRSSTIPNTPLLSNHSSSTSKRIPTQESTSSTPTTVHGLKPKTSNSSI